jgi:hypothetical protein
MGTTGVKLTIPIQKTNRILSWSVALLVAAHLVGEILVAWFGRTGPVWLFSRLTDLGLEKNFPALFSAGQLAVSGLLALAIACAVKSTKRPHFLHWLGLALILLFLSLDEALALHEKLTEPLQSVLHTSRRALWVIPYGGLLVLFGASYLRFTLRLPPWTRKRVIIAGCIYVTGALLLETLGWYHATHHGQSNAFYFLCSLTEESLEMAALVLLIHTFMTHLVREFGEFALALRDDAAPALSPGP